jgi:general secretion pathway protein D
MGRGKALSAFSHFARRGTQALCALLLVILAAGAAPAAAQQQFTPVTRPPTYPVTLTAIKLLSESKSQSRFEFDFEPTATTYANAIGRPNQPGLGFASTTRGPGAVQPSDMKGLVRGLEFQQVQDILIVRFNATTTATYSVAQTGDKSIEVTVRSGNYKEEAAQEVATSGPMPLPPAYEPPEDYALVLLKYADVSEVVGLLTDGQTVKSNDVFIPSEPAFGSNSLTGNTYQPQAQTQAPGANDDPLGQSIDANIGIDRRLNAIWLKGSPERIAQMKQMIAAIDIPVDSVVLETQFVELTEQGLKALGLDFNNANGQLGVVTFQTGQFIPPGVPAGAHLTSTQFQAALYAQISKGNGRIVSRPRISAQSGSTAKIITGDALPILTSIALSGVNGVSQQVQYVNVGVTLQIAPRVSGDGWVSSHVFAVVSSVTGTSQGYPTISQREAETSATVRDGDSFVIGGLTQDETISTKSKIPLLGDIPLVGLAFRNERTTRTKTELYIIVTPHVVHRIGSNPNVIPANAPLYAPSAATAPPTDVNPPPPPAVPQQR